MSSRQVLRPGTVVVSLVCALGCGSSTRKTDGASSGLDAQTSPEVGAPGIDGRRDGTSEADGAGAMSGTGGQLGVGGAAGDVAGSGGRTEVSTGVGGTAATGGMPGAGGTIPSGGIPGAGGGTVVGGTGGGVPAVDAARDHAVDFPVDGAGGADGNAADGAIDAAQDQAADRTDVAADLPTGTGGVSGTGGLTGTGGLSGTGGITGTGGAAATGGATGEPSFCSDDHWPVVSVASNRYSVTTSHYDLVLEVSSTERAAELGKMAELLWAAETHYFGASPALAAGSRLAAGFYDSADAWAAAMQSDGVAVPTGAGGYYSPGNRKAYMYRQPTEYFTTSLFLHELTHQFHWLARAGNSGRGPGWYIEGVADYLSSHDWDGRCLRLGTLPMLSQDDYPASALAAVSATSFDLTAAMNGGAGAGHPFDWALYSFLERGAGGSLKSAFATFRSLVDAGSADWLADFKAQVGEPSQLQPAFRTWLAAEQAPMTPVFVDWVHEGPGRFHAAGVGMGVTSVAKVKRAVSHYEMTMPVPTGGYWYGGVLVGFDDSNNYVGYVAGPDGLSVIRVSGGSLDWRYAGPSLPVPPAGGSYAWTVDHGTGGSTITVNGVTVTESGGLTPAAGAFVDGSNLLFTNTSWR